MPRVTLPKNTGTFRVATARAGNFIVINNKTGKNKVIVPCRDMAEANQLCDRLNSGKHPGQIWK